MGLNCSRVGLSHVADTAKLVTTGAEYREQGSSWVVPVTGTGAAGRVLGGAAEGHDRRVAGPDDGGGLLHDLRRRRLGEADRDRLLAEPPRGGGRRGARGGGIRREGRRRRDGVPGVRLEGSLGDVAFCGE